MLSRGAGKGKGKVKGKGKGLSEAPSAGSKWKHPDGVQLENVEVGGLYDGQVTNVGRYGIFVNIGAVKDGIVSLPSKMRRGVKRGMMLRNLCVEACNPAEEKIELRLDEEGLAELAMIAKERRSDSAAPRRGGAARREGSRGPAPQGQRSRSSPPRPPARMEMAEGDRVPLEELADGSVVDGVVRNVGPYGVFLDIGAMGDAKLKIPTKMGRELYRQGDFIEGVHIDWVDPVLRRIQVSVPNSDFGPTPAKDAGRGPAEAMRASGDGKGDGRMPLSAVGEGSMVDGYVCKAQNGNIVVDIGCEKNAKLRVPRELAQEIQLGDEVVGMRVDKVDAERQVLIVSIEDPELAITDEAEVPQPKAKAKGKAKAGAKRKAAPPEPVNKPREGRDDVLSVGDFLDGTVTQASPTEGIYVDVGRGMNARLVVAAPLMNQFRRGDQVYGMRVERIGPRTNDLLLTIEEPHLDVQRPRQRQPPREARAPPPPAERAPAPRAPAPRAERQPASTTGRKQLENLRVGAMASGIVTRIGPSGVFVDFGAVRTGRLDVSREDAKKFQIGDEIEGLVIEEVNLRPAEVTLALTYELGDEPYEETVEVAPAKPPRQRVGARLGAQPGARAR